MPAFIRLSLARQYLLVSFLVLFCGMLIIGAWVGRQIEIGVMHRTAAITALYVDSLVSHHLQYLVDKNNSGVSHNEELDALLTTTPLGKHIVAFKVWGSDGHILYSTNPNLIGLQFPIEGGLEKAFDGEVVTEVSDLNREENFFEQQEWSELIETYTPVRIEGEIVATIEFYQTMDELRDEIRTAQQRSWAVVGVSTVVIYLLLAGLVSRASNTILSQQSELQEKVAQLTGLLEQNEQLHSRVSRAAARTTALNERFLRRIAADLHDGPGQDLALALLRIDELADVCASCTAFLVKRKAANDDFGTIQSALRSALTDMRTILAGLHLPEIRQLSVIETVERAVRDYKHKASVAVDLTVSDVPEEAPLSVKITLYRILQEALANGYKHADGADQRVSITGKENLLIVEISDGGPGFDKRDVLPDDHLGLIGMRERVEILAGTFEVKSVQNNGTLIRASLPLTLLEVDNE